MKASDFIREIDTELADFLDEELKDISEPKYELTDDFVLTDELLYSLTDEELQDLLFDASIEVDLCYNDEELYNKRKLRYDAIKESVTNERLRRSEI